MSTTNLTYDDFVRRYTVGTSGWYDMFLAGIRDSWPDVYADLEGYVHSLSFAEVNWMVKRLCDGAIKDEESWMAANNGNKQNYAPVHFCCLQTKHTWMQDPNTGYFVRQCLSPSEERMHPMELLVKYEHPGLYWRLTALVARMERNDPDGEYSVDWLLLNYKHASNVLMQWYMDSEMEAKWCLDGARLMFFLQTWFEVIDK